MTKTEIRHLIADGQLRPAAQAALEYAEKCRLTEPTNALTVLNGNLENHQKQWITGQVSFEEMSRAHARSAAALTDLLDQLPDTPAPGRKIRMLDEHTYKWRIFWIFVGAKLIVLGRLAYHWGQGGFTRAEFFATLTLLAAALAAHTLVMFDDLLRHEQEHSTRRRYVSGVLARTVQGLIVAYAVALFMAIEWKAMTAFSYAEMNTMLTLVETLLGGFVGKIVARFFKSEK